MTDYDTIATPLGPLTILFHGGNMVSAGFTEDPAYLRSRLARRHRTDALVWQAAPLGVEAAVDAYFSGDLAAIDGVAIELEGTPGQIALWRELRAVAPGSRCTYRELAARVGRPNSPRAAGAACSRNPIALIVPCHRIIRTDGGLGGYLYGLEIKEALLAYESAGTRNEAGNE